MINTIMKPIFLYTACSLLLLAASCKKDNYDAPASTLKGRIVYQNQPIGVGFNDVSFELWQGGWGKSGAINITVDQDGTYSAQLFNGDYKLVIPSFQGPFLKLTNATSHSDTIPVSLSGSTTLDIEVLPYYMIKQASFSVSTDSVVTAQLSLDKIVTDARAKDIEKVTLYLNKTSFINSSTAVNTSISGSSITDIGHISLGMKLASAAVTDAAAGTQPYVYARIGIKISGVEDLLFSNVQKIDL